MLAALLIAAAAAPPPAKPSWAIFGRDQECALVRSATSNGGTVLELDLFPTQDSPQVLIFNPEWKHDLADFQPIVLRVLPSGAPLKLTGETLSVAWRAGHGVSLDPPAGFFDDFGAGTGLTVEAQGKPPVTLRYGGGPAAVKALRDCADRLLASWGVDPVARAALSRQPKPASNPQRWLTNMDFPRDAIGVSGQTAVRLSIGPDGRVTDCAVVATSGNTSLDTASCTLLRQRGRFTPALDAAGRPASGFFVTRFKWWS